MPLKVPPTGLNIVLYSHTASLISVQAKLQLNIPEQDTQLIKKHNDTFLFLTQQFIYLNVPFMMRSKHT